MRKLYNGLSHPRVCDLRGQKFSRLLVLHQDLSKTKAVYWVCRCDCGSQVSLQGSWISSGNTGSCGCLRRELRTKHGLFKTDEYMIWYGIKDRCYSSDRDPKAFERYGGRGIAMCEEWRNDVAAFYRDMGPRPNKQMTIERIDNNKGYYKENCVWATRKQQGRNRRDNRIVKYQGIEMPMCVFIERHCPYFTHEAVRYRLKQGLSTEQILSIPKGAHFSKLVAGKRSE
jgi:hypothetical protein